jgi:hypothetical protein
MSGGRRRLNALGQTSGGLPSTVFVEGRLFAGGARLKNVGAPTIALNCIVNIVEENTGVMGEHI